MKEQNKRKLENKQTIKNIIQDYSNNTNNDQFLMRHSWSGRTSGCHARMT